MTGSLAHRCVLVTGAAQGLGLGIAQRLAQDGAGLAPADIDPIVYERLCEPPFTERACALVNDRAESDAAEHLVSGARARLLATNERAPYFLAQGFVAQLEESDSDPCVVNIRSRNALAAMTRALAVELAPRLRVLSVSPSTVRTLHLEHLIETGQAAPRVMLDRLLIKHFIQVSEIADLVAFLFGPSAASLTGCDWLFDGGYTAQ